MGKWIHRLSNFDENTKTADCAHCGHVSIDVFKGFRRCSNANRASKLSHRYGIAFTADDLLVIPSECPLCGRGEKLVYDHCHTSGSFRGWLCNNCNVVLGLMRDDVQALKRMVNYLESS